MPCILCYMQKTKENEQIKDDLHWFSAKVCSEHVLKNLANLSLIMIVHIKMILMGKKAHVHECIAKTWQISLSFVILTRFVTYQEG